MRKDSRGADKCSNYEPRATQKLQKKTIMSNIYYSFKSHLTLVFLIKCKSHPITLYMEIRGFLNWGTGLGRYC